MRDKISKKNLVKISNRFLSQEKNEIKSEENEDVKGAVSVREKCRSENILKEFHSLTPNIVQDFIRERF